MTRPIRIGAQLWPGGTPDYKTWRDAVVHAEDIGTDIIFGYDHFHAPSFTEIVNAMPVLHDEQPDITNFEGWTALASWAEITSRAEIGLLVSGMGYRNPDLLADMARTVDHISGGRLILGLGAGWYEKDYTTYGFEYGTWTSRFDNFDAGLARIEDRLKELNPAPLREIPILIGGSGAKRTIPAIARHGDIWHSFLPIDDFRTVSALLDKEAAEAGRSGADIERSVFWVSPESADEFVAAGATTFTTELHPTGDGFDFTVLNEMIAWRDTK
ncbi:LLM class F420-dependent oxidoreductase [Mycolicibacterium sp. Dal123E01]|uniref:LLM class F420-dependent oxidoreductase n=1 Tax=Mycolicibacterium sp. Dal123E01 TaxID=3457578 RepID=UPI00403EA6EE